MDSATCLLWSQLRFQNVRAVCFNYGQFNRFEINAAKKICREMKIPIEIILLKNIAKDSGLGKNKNVKKNKTFEVPARNGILIWQAAQMAAQLGIYNLVLGTSDLIETESFPDCSAEFMEKTAESLRLGTGLPFEIHRPLERLSKQEIFNKAEEMGGLSTILKSFSCFKNQFRLEHAWGSGCGKCPACIARINGWNFFEKGIAPQAFPKRFFFKEDRFTIDTSFNLIRKKYLLSHIKNHAHTKVIRQLPDIGKMINLQKNISNLNEELRLKNGWMYVPYPKNLSLFNWVSLLKEKKVPLALIARFGNDMENPFLPDLLYGLLGQRHWIEDQSCKKIINQYLNLCIKVFSAHSTQNSSKNKILEKIGQAIFDFGLLENSKKEIKIIGSHLLTNPSHFKSIKSDEISKIHLLDFIKANKIYPKKKRYYCADSLEQIRKQMAELQLAWEKTNFNELKG